MQVMPSLTLLLDECITIRMIDPSERASYYHSIDLVGRGASDDSIIEYAQARNFMIITRDRNLCYRCVKRNIAAAFYDLDNSAHVMTRRNCRRDSHGARVNTMPDDERLHIRIKLACKMLPIFRKPVENSKYNKRDYFRLFIRIRRNLRRYIRMRIKRLRKLFVKTANRSPQKIQEVNKPKCKQCKPQPARIVWHGYASVLPIMPVAFCICGQFCHGENKLRNHVKNSHYAELASAS